MKHEFSLAHLTALDCTPPELISIAANAGYDYVSLRMTAVTEDENKYPLMTSKKLLKETKNRLLATGISVLDIELVRLDPETEPESYVRFLETGKELGAKAVIAQLPDPDRMRATDRFATLCDLGAKFDLTINLEFPSWTETGDLQTAVDVLSAVGKPNAGLLVDTLHFSQSQSSLQQLKSLPKSWFNFIHLCDAQKRHSITTEEKIHIARADRLFPGKGELEIKEMLNSMPTVPYSLEIPNETLLQKLGPEEYTRQALKASKHFLTEQAVALPLSTNTKSVVNGDF